MKAQNDLNLIHEKFSSSMEELKIQQDEIERLNQRIKLQMNDMKELQHLNDHLEEKSKESDKFMKQYQHQCELQKQEITNLDKTIENIKSEWTTNIRNHEEEIRGFKQHIEILNEELSHTKLELNDAINKVIDNKHNINDLNDQIDEITDNNEKYASKINKLEILNKDLETKLLSYSSDNSMLQHQYNNANTQIQNLNAKLNEVEIRHDQLLKNFEKSESNNRSLSESAIEMKFKVIIKSNLILLFIFILKKNIRLLTRNKLSKLLTLKYQI
jgi:chromosome segregation ATPase